MPHALRPSKFGSPDRHARTPGPTPGEQMGGPTNVKGKGKHRGKKHKRGRK